jgi:hypothetical protein
MRKFFHRVIEDRFGLVEGNSINEVFIVEVEAVDAGHDSVHFLLLGVSLFDYVSLVNDRFFVLSALLALSCHSNLIISN